MRLVTLACVALLVAPPAAEAATAAQRKKATALIKQGENHYRAGRYREAALALEQANELDPHPRLVYNIARAYDQAGDLRAALEHYQRYINSSEGTDPTLLKRSSLAVDRLRGLIDKEEQLREERDRLEQERLRAEAQAQKDDEARRLADEEAARRARERLIVEQHHYDRSRVIAFVAAGVGAAAMGTGGFFGFQALQSKSEFQRAGTLAEKQVLEAQTRERALIADIGWGVGAAAAITAAVLFPKGPRPQLGEPATLAVGPGGAMLTLRF